MAGSLTLPVSARDHAYFSIVQKIQQEMGDQLRFVFRNFSLTDVHPNALAAADSQKTLF